MMRSSLPPFRVLCALAALVLSTQAQFTDVTNASGLGGVFVTSPGDSPKAFQAAGVAVADFDDDGWDDVAAQLGSGRKLALYRNQGDGTFADVAADAGVDVQMPHGGLMWGDYDADGDEDLFLMAMENQVLVTVMTPSGPKVIVYPVDVGLAELTILGYGEYKNYLFRNDGDGTFTDVTDFAGLRRSGRWGASLGDLDLDGDLDLVTVSWRGDTTHFYANDGDGTFTDVTPANIRDDKVFGFAPQVVDYDLDGDQDVLMAGDFKTSRIWRNFGNWTFFDISFAAVNGLPLSDENGMGSAIGDYDNDGDFDWFVTSIYLAPPQMQPARTTGVTGNRMYRNNGNGLFTDATTSTGTRDGSWGWAASFFDYDNDADLDLYHVNGWNYYAYPTDQARLFENNANGTFTERATALGVADAGQGRGMAVFDYDNDGDLDIVLCNRLTGLVLYRNDTVNANAWLEVRIDDPIGHPAGIGCIVTAAASGVPTQKRFIGYGCNYMSQNPPHAWFGFGGTSATEATITIQWPDGQQTSQPVTLGQRVTLTRSGR